MQQNGHGSGPIAPTKNGVQLPEGQISASNYVGNPNSGSFIDWDQTFLEKGYAPPAEANKSGTPSFYMGKATGFGKTSEDKLGKSHTTAIGGMPGGVDPQRPYGVRPEHGGYGQYRQDITGDSPFEGTGAATPVAGPAPAAPPPAPTPSDSRNPMPFAAQLAPVIGRMQGKVPTEVPIPGMQGKMEAAPAESTQMDSMPWINWEQSLLGLMGKMEGKKMSDSIGRGHGRPEIDVQAQADEQEEEDEGTKKSLTFDDLMKGLLTIVERSETRLKKADGPSASEGLQKAKYRSKKRVGGKWVYDYGPRKKKGDKPSGEQLGLDLSPKPKSPTDGALEEAILSDRASKHAENEEVDAAARKKAAARKEMPKTAARHKADAMARDLKASPGVEALKDPAAAKTLADHTVRQFLTLSRLSGGGDRAAGHVLAEMHQHMRNIGHDLAAAGRSDLVVSVLKEMRDSTPPPGDRGSHQQLVAQHGKNLVTGMDAGKKKARKAGLSTSEKKRPATEDKNAARRAARQKARKQEAASKAAVEAIEGAHERPSKLISTLASSQAVTSDISAAKAEIASFLATKAPRDLAGKKALLSEIEKFTKEAGKAYDYADRATSVMHGYRPSNNTQIEGAKRKRKAQLKALEDQGWKAQSKLASKIRAQEKKQAKKSEDYMETVEYDLSGQILSKGLHAFRHAKGDDALPEEYLYDYLCAFVEEAYEHEKEEDAHKNLKAEDGLRSIARSIMSELVMTIPQNPNLKRACAKFPCTADSIAGLIVAKGMHRPAADSDWTDDMESIFAMGGEAMAYSMTAHGMVPDHQARPGLQLHKSSPYVMRDEPGEDPFEAIRQRKAAFTKSLWSTYQPPKEYKIDQHCPVHGGRDISKAHQLSNPMQPCTCNGEPNAYG